MREDNPVYEDIEKLPELKKFMEERLEDYNMEPGIIGMDLVLFKDAIEHGNMCEISVDFLWLVSTVCKILEYTTIN